MADPHQLMIDELRKLNKTLGEIGKKLGATGSDASFADAELHRLVEHDDIRHPRSASVTYSGPELQPYNVEGSPRVYDKISSQAGIQSFYGQPNASILKEEGERGYN